MVEQVALEILLQWLAGELRKGRKRRKRRRKNSCAIDVDSKVMVGDSVRSIIMARRRRCNLLGWRCKALVVFNGVFNSCCVFSSVRGGTRGRTRAMVDLKW